MTGLSLQDKVTLGCAMLGGMTGVVGAFAVLRRRALVGDMLAHASLPGVCLAYILFRTRDMLVLSLGALAVGLLAVALMTLAVRWTRTKEDAAIGIILSTFFGMGVVLLSRAQQPPYGGGSAGLDKYIFGEPANMLDSDLTLLLAIGVGALLITFLFFKEFKLTAFDSDFARSQGWPTLALDLGMMALVAVVTIAGLPIVGAILIAALLILPAAAARMWTNRLHWMLVLAGGVGATAGAVGSRLGRDLPTGPMIVLTASAVFFASILLAPGRGVLSRLWTELRLRIRVGREHLMRSLYELCEPALPQLQPLSLDRLREHRHWEPWMFHWLLRSCERQGLLRVNQESVALTPLGLRRAAETTRTHRLWEMYMMHYAGSAPDHVDRSADDVEHLLPAELIVELEEKLAQQGRLPPTIPEVPTSPHVIENAAT